MIEYKFTELEKQLFTTLDKFQLENDLNTDFGKCFVYEESFSILKENLPEIFNNFSDDWVEELTHLWLEGEGRDTCIIYN